MIQTNQLVHVMHHFSCYQLELLCLIKRFILIVYCSYLFIHLLLFISFMSLLLLCQLNLSLFHEYFMYTCQLFDSLLFSNPLFVFVLRNHVSCSRTLLDVLASCIHSCCLNFSCHVIQPLSLCLFKLFASSLLSSVIRIFFPNNSFNFLDYLQ